MFTSGLDLVDVGTAGFLLPLAGARLVRSAVSTPQVLLDHQVYEEGAELVCNFDHAAAVYPEGLVESLAEYHACRLRELAADPAAWHRCGGPELPAAQLCERRRANATAMSLPRGGLHAFVLPWCRDEPDRVAVIDANGVLTYGELEEASAALASLLGDAGRGLVAVRLPKGRAQVIAVLAILRAGGSYLPIDARWPDVRVARIVEHSGAALLLDRPWWDEHVGATTPPSGLDVSDVESSWEDTAYVIYTSGSTGTPKGVIIAHGAASNTLRDLTARFDLSPDDRVLAVSSLAFDLSVFDTFGLLGAGGVVVLPPESANPDPQAWGAIVAAERVTVWNSVPALLELTLEYLGESAARTLRSLRLIMLSGDWVSPVLVDRLVQVCPQAEIVALGGATEASIWSNWYPATERPSGWTSVPYGWPLANQSMHVLTADLTDAPTWSVGDLHLGGAGVATGYLHDPERTAAAFYPHPRTGERLYRTGDRARYRPGGVVEFLGRNDHQVKVGGYRIELGEIENTMLSAPAVEAAV
ncbi:MAG: amino acid adenylation domain-containing protein, partial [Pseudonocardia sp.]|nr:amino acid adenylation domain-containing protein [Pseudonocardia sp.]